MAKPNRHYREEKEIDREYLEEIDRRAAVARRGVNISQLGVGQPFRARCGKFYQNHLVGRRNVGGNIVDCITTVRRDDLEAQA